MQPLLGKMMNAWRDVTEQWQLPWMACKWYSYWYFGALLLHGLWKKTPTVHMWLLYW